VASRPKFWPRPRTFGLGLASISLFYGVIGYFSCKNRVKFGNFVNFSGNNLKFVPQIRPLADIVHYKYTFTYLLTLLKSYIINRYLVLFS